MGLFTRAIRPPDDITPNPNDPASVPPSTVGPDQLVVPGDPHGVVVDPTVPETTGPPPRILPSAWSGWPADWWTPMWNGSPQSLVDTAFMCIDLNASVLSTMPPYLVGAAPSLSADWLSNPDPNVYTCWEEFLKELFWFYQAAGETFVRWTARYSTGWPARFHVVPPAMVAVELDAGLRRYRIGDVDVTGEILHIRYQGSVDQARGTGPLQAAGARVTAAQALSRYATTIAGTTPPSILKYAEELGPGKADLLKAQWVSARNSGIGEPAVLEGGIEWEPASFNPKDMALIELIHFNESRIANLLGVPPFLVGLPSGGDSMTYSNVTSLFDFHWRASLRPKAQQVMSALSGWALPRGTRVELNRDEYVQPGPLERAQTAQILNSIVDPVTGQPVLSVREIRVAERLDNTTPTDVAEGVLK
jgi:HK97 family phage portal protein